MKYFFYYKCCILIDNQLVSVFRILYVSVRGKVFNTFPHPSLCIKLCPDFNRYITTIIIVHNVFNRYHEHIHFACIIITVIIVGYGDKPYSLLRKYLLHIPITFIMISSETRKVLYNNTINFPGISISHHFIKSGTVKTGTAYTIIDILFLKNQIIMVIDIHTYHFFLIDNTVARSCNRIIFF